MPDSHEVANVRCGKETAKAILAVFEDGTSKWIPKSCVLEDSEVYKQGSSGTLIVAQWFAEKELG